VAPISLKVSVALGSLFGRMNWEISTPGKADVGTASANVKPLSARPTVDEASVTARTAGAEVVDVTKLLVCITDALL